MPANPKIPRRFLAVALDRAMYVNRLCYDTQLHYVVSFEGRLDEARLRRAVRLAMDAEPVFGCRYVAGKKPYWERRDDLDSLPLCEVAETTDVQREIERFAARPSEATRDPLVQACIVRDASDSLCLKVNHVAADGAGGKELLYRIAALYRSLKDEPGLGIEPNLGDRGAGQLFRHFGWRRCRRAFSFKAPKPPENLWQFPSYDLEDIGTRAFASRQLEPAAAAALREYARRAGATLNDLVTAAFFRALWRFLDFPAGVPQPVWMPMDIRGHLPSGKTQAICNLIAMLYPTLARVPGERFEDTLRRVQESLPSPTQREQYAVLFLLLVGLTHRLLLPARLRRMERVSQRSSETRAAGVHLANNRTFNVAELDFCLPVTDVSQLSPAAIPPGLFMSVLSFRGWVKFSITYFNRALKAEDVEQFFDTFLQELSSPAEPPALARAAQAAG